MFPCRAVTEAVLSFACRMMAPSRLLAAFGLSLLFAGGPFGIRAADAQSVCNGGSSCTVVVSLQLDRPYVASLVLSQSVASGPWTSSASSATLWPVAATSAAATAGVTIPLFYRTLWNWTTSPPGAYTIPVNLTLTSP